MDFTFIIQCIEFILSVGLIITLHEFGHFIVAKMFGVRVERFSVFLSPWVYPVVWKPGKYIKFFVTNDAKRKLEEEACRADVENFESIRPKSWKDTEYTLGWLPIAGYCKFNTSLFRTDEDTNVTIYPDWDIRNAKSWQRLLISLCGPGINFLLAFCIFISLNLYSTLSFDYSKIEDGTERTLIEYSPYAKKVGFKDNDQIIRADSFPLRSIAFIQEKSIVASAKSVLVKRGEDTISINIPPYFVDSLNFELKNNIFAPVLVHNYFIPILRDVKSGSPADSLGLRGGDIIGILNGDTLYTYDNFVTSITKESISQYDITVLRIRQDGDIDTIRRKFSGYNELNGIRVAYNIDQVDSLMKIVMSRLAKSSVNVASSMTTEVAQGSAKSTIQSNEDDTHRGYLGIIEAFPAHWDWIQLLYIIALYSIGIGVFNLLPFPGLDGGQSLFALLEIVMRRKLSENLLGWINNIGWILLMLWFLYDNIRGIIARII